jgi:hypothetical protein
LGDAGTARKLSARPMADGSVMLDESDERIVCKLGHG